MKLYVLLFILNLKNIKSEDNDHEKNLPTSCHVCKHTVAEFLEELGQSANSNDVLQLGQVFQSEKPKTIVYHKSELRLIEALENTCEKIKGYKVHKDRSNHFRYAKDESSTFITLKNLKKRGVEVDLGFPDEMWDSPDAEIVELKRKCENIIEKYEDQLSDWYFNHKETNLFDWFCKNLILKRESHDCLNGHIDNSDNANDPADDDHYNKDNDGDKDDDGDGYNDDDHEKANKKNSRTKDKRREQKQIKIKNKNHTDEKEQIQMSEKKESLVKPDYKEQEGEEGVEEKSEEKKENNKEKITEKKEKANKPKKKRKSDNSSGRKKKKEQKTKFLKMDEENHYVESEENQHVEL